MSFHVCTRMGEMHSEPAPELMKEVLAELDSYVDDEHPDVSLTHESEWSLSAFPSGLLIWGNLEEGEEQHMRNVSREKVYELWIKLANGRISDINREPWLPGYG